MQRSSALTGRSRSERTGQYFAWEVADSALCSSSTSSGREGPATSPSDVDGVVSTLACFCIHCTRACV